MRVPGFGETNAHICDEKVEQLLLVSYYLSHVVYPDKYSHSERPPFLEKQDIGDPSALFMPDERALCQDMHRAGSSSLWGNSVPVGARVVRSGRGRHPGDGVQAFMDAVWGTVWPGTFPALPLHFWKDIGKI
jgi:hypothetical protein